MRIALDAMGGDYGPQPTVAGGLKALAASPDLSIVLVGDQAQIEPILQAANVPSDGRVEIFHCTEAVGMMEKPVDALRKKPDNSISHCWKLMATGKVDGLVSSGNTGAVVGAGLFTRKFLKGIRKPGIAAVMPTTTGKCVVLDVGANVYPKPSHLVQYGVMGSVFARHMLGVEKPRVGLMNVGEEEGKGHDLVQKTYDLFRKGPMADRFVGNVEGRDVHKGTVDVIVTDGFVGNVLLKYAQGLVQFVLGAVGKEVIAPLTTEKATAAGLMNQLVAKFHYSNTGGAPLLGVDGVCIICHGSSDELAIANAVGVAAQETRVKLNEKIVTELATLPAMAEEE